MINAPSGIHAPLKNGLPRLRIYVRSYSAMIQLNRDFKEFLIALNDHSVEYLLVGGYAVAHRISPILLIFLKRRRNQLGLHPHDRRGPVRVLGPPRRSPLDAGCTIAL
jgi:hypothetical protein